MTAPDCVTVAVAAERLTAMIAQLDKYAADDTICRCGRDQTVLGEILSVSVDCEIGHGDPIGAGNATGEDLRVVLAGLERDDAPQLPDPRGPEHQKVVTDWHTIAAEGFKSGTPDGDEWFVEYDIDHPAECDRLPYGEQCLMDRVLGLFGDDGQLGAATRRARAHVYGPDQNGDFEEWIEWGDDV